MTDEIWTLARQKNGSLDRISFELLARAVEISRGQRQVTAVVLGPVMATSELQLLIAHGADRVLAVELAAQDFDMECYAETLRVLVGEHQPEILIAGADSFGRSLLPYVAMKLHTGLTADCTELELDQETGLLLQTRPAAGGNIMATIRCLHTRPQMATVRPRSHKLLEPDDSRSGMIIRLAASTASSQRIVLESYIPNAPGTNISDADRIVAVGRGIKRAENLAPIRKLADLLGAVLGASREVVERGWLPYSCQIGLSGKTVSPRLYVAIGISGAIQHLAGIQTAETVVAINRDPEAPIFKVADFGIVGDYSEVVSAWMDRLAKGKS